MSVISQRKVGGAVMRGRSFLCYFFSILFLGVGYSQIHAYTNFLGNPANSDGAVVNLALAMVFLGLTIILALSGFVFYCRSSKEVKRTVHRHRQSSGYYTAGGSYAKTGCLDKKYAYPKYAAVNLISRQELCK